MRGLAILLMIALILSPLKGISVFGNALTTEYEDVLTDQEELTNQEVLIDNSASLIEEENDKGILSYIAEYTPLQLVNKVLESNDNIPADLNQYIPNITEELITVIHNQHGELYYVDTKKAINEECYIYVFMNKDSEGDIKNVIFIMVNNTDSEKHFQVNVTGLDSKSIAVSAYSQIIVTDNEEDSLKTESPKASEEPESSLVPEESVIPEESEVPETNKPVESVEPAESSQPEESAEPAESNGPVESTEPMESTETTESTEPMESTEPTESNEPVESVEPTESSQPGESTEPAESSEPVDTVGPVASNKSGKIIGLLDNSKSLGSNLNLLEVTYNNENDLLPVESADVEDTEDSGSDTPITEVIEGNDQQSEEQPSSEVSEGNTDNSNKDTENITVEIIQREVEEEPEGYLVLNATEVAVNEVSMSVLLALLNTGGQFSVNIFDYDKDTVNNSIGYSSSNLLIGNNSQYGPQNTWTGNGTNNQTKGVTQGIAQNNYVGGKIAFNYSTNGVDLFNNLTRGITAYRNLDFPFFTQEGDYYVFDSSKTKVRMSNNQLVEGGRFHGFWPVNKLNDTSANEYFGMTFSFEFMMPKNGQVNAKDMLFEFHGDDDVWIYIKDQNGTNGKLALDLGGIHGECNGTINFATGVITHENVYVNSSNYQKQVKWYLYTEADARERGYTENFARYVGLSRTAYANYQLDLYYMERGGNESNCYMKFNMPTIPKNQIKIEKSVEGIIPSEDVNKAYQFELYTSDNEKEGFTKQNSFSLVAGQNASFGIEENKYFYIKETDPGKSNETLWSVSGREEETLIGAQSQVGYAGSGAIVICTNKYENLTLQIEKKITSSNSILPKDAVFEFMVKIDNSPYSGKILINDRETTITEGFLQLKANEIAKIKDLTKNTKYSVTELNYQNNYYKSVLITTDTTIIPKDNSIPTKQVKQPSDNNPIISSTLEGNMYLEKTEADNTETHTEIQSKWGYVEENGTWVQLPDGYDTSKLQNNQSEYGYYVNNQWSVVTNGYNNTVKTYVIPGTYKEFPCTDSIWFFGYTYYYQDDKELSESGLKSKYEKDGYTFWVNGKSNPKQRVCAVYKPLIKRVYSQKDVEVKVEVTIPGVTNQYPSDISLVFTNNLSIIRDGEINIKKSLVDSKDNLVSDFEDNTFIFKLTNIDPFSPGYGTVAYGSITVSKGQVTGNTFTFNHLPRGTYELQEVDHMRYQLVSMSDNGVVILNNSELVNGIIRKDIQVKNHKTVDDFFSDSSVVVNKGTNFYTTPIQ